MAAGLADKLQATPGTPTMLRWEEGSNDPDPWSGITFALRPIVNTAPSVSLTSPANNATFTAPASIILTADAQDSDGTVAQVEFFQGTTLVATVTTAPYTFTLNNVAAAGYSFTAKATDNQGASTTSAAVNVTVNAVAAAQLYFIHTDHLNSPRRIYNQAQQLVWSWDNTDPFGGNPPNENPSGLGTFTCNLRLPGQYFDKETNNHYNYFRDYDPATGRYIQSDPVGLWGGINTYLYVGGSPIGLSDPKGELGNKPPFPDPRVPDPPRPPKSPASPKFPAVPQECVVNPTYQTCFTCCQQQALRTIGGAASGSVCRELCSHRDPPYPDAPYQTQGPTSIVCVAPSQ